MSLCYADNKGKVVLKTVISYILDNFLPNAKGIVTIDSDGQHLRRHDEMFIEFLQHPDSLVLVLEHLKNLFLYVVNLKFIDKRRP